MTNPQRTCRCVIATGIFPPDVGGPARYVPAVAGALTNRGIDCSVVTLGEADAIEEFPFSVTRISRRLLPPVRMLRTVQAIAARARRADVIFANGLHFEAALASRLSGRPLVLKIVGDEVWERASNWQCTSLSIDEFQTRPASWIVGGLRAARHLALSSSSALIVPSHYTASLVRGWMPSAPASHVIPNAAAPTRAGAFDLAPALQSLSRAVFVGRLIPLKRVDGILRAAAALPNLGVLVIGDGPERRPLEGLAADLGIAERVQFSGVLTPGQIAAAVARSDVLVLNSTTENCPHSVLEAMALGVPVVATRVGGVPELVVDGVSGLLIDPFSAGELSEALRRIIGDNELRRQLSDGARRVSERFSWGANVEAVARVLGAVARRSDQTLAQPST